MFVNSYVLSQVKIILIIQVFKAPVSGSYVEYLSSTEIKQIIERTGLSQREFANKIGSTDGSRVGSKSGPIAPINIAATPPLSLNLLIVISAID